MEPVAWLYPRNWHLQMWSSIALYYSPRRMGLQYSGILALYYSPRRMGLLYSGIWYYTIVAILALYNSPDLALFYSTGIGTILQPNFVLFYRSAIGNMRSHYIDFHVLQLQFIIMSVMIGDYLICESSLTGLLQS